MKTFDAAMLASVLAAAAATLAACDGPDCDRSTPQGRQNCDASHVGGHGAWVGGSGGRGGVSPDVARGGFGGSVGRFFGGFFSGGFGE